jgi:hypothetical protein
VPSNATRAVISNNINNNRRADATTIGVDSMWFGLDSTRFCLDSNVFCLDSIAGPQSTADSIDTTSASAELHTKRIGILLATVSITIDE